MKHVSHVNLYNLMEYLILTMEIVITKEVGYNTSSYNTDILNCAYPSLPFCLVLLQ